MLVFLLVYLDTPTWVHYVHSKKEAQNLHVFKW